MDRVRAFLRVAEVEYFAVYPSVLISQFDMN